MLLNLSDSLGSGAFNMLLSDYPVIPRVLLPSQRLCHKQKEKEDRIGESQLFQEQTSSV
jgi:hypothetical protein